MSIEYTQEPLCIITPVPDGKYEVTLNISASSDTVFSVNVLNSQTVAKDVKIKHGETKEFTFTVNVSSGTENTTDCSAGEGIITEILCDGEINAVSQVSPIY